ncbi:MAG: hypothetical protein KBD19_03680 [Candidatus Moranbacteria bacterium]|nr:hypothetical protein [Candidatus Moranbacteria bacterium]
MTNVRGCCIREGSAKGEQVGLAPSFFFNKSLTRHCERKRSNPDPDKQEDPGSRNRDDILSHFSSKEDAMKTPLKSVLATLVALFLTLSLSGCLEEGAKTASQGGAASSSVFQTTKEGVLGSDGTIKFYLPAGTGALAIKFNSSSNRMASKASIEKMLADSGVNIEMSNDTRFGLYYQIRVSKKRILISLPVTGIKNVVPYGLNGSPVFEWNYVNGFVFDSRA